MVPQRVGPKIADVHDFAASFETGEVAERIVRDYLLSEGWDVNIVLQPKDKKHGDYYVFHPDKGGDDSFGIEVKCDVRAEETQNLFIETEVVTKGVSSPGWAEYTIARYIFWYFPKARTIWTVPTVKLKYMLEYWNKKYPKAKAYNKGWYGVGILVPALEVLKIREQRIEL